MWFIDNYWSHIGFRLLQYFLFIILQLLLIFFWIIIPINISFLGNKLGQINQPFFFLFHLLDLHRLCLPQHLIPFDINFLLIHKYQPSLIINSLKRHNTFFILLKQHLIPHTTTWFHIHLIQTIYNNQLICDFSLLQLICYDSKLFIMIFIEIWCEWVFNYLWFYFYLLLALLAIYDGALKFW